MVSGTVDWRGVGWYLIIAFGLAWAIDAGIWRLGGIGDRGIFQGGAALSMWCPALAAWTVRHLRREGCADVGWRWGAPAAWAGLLLLLPVLFAAAYGATALLGWGRLDFSREGVAARLHLPAGLLPPHWGAFLAVLWLATVLVTPFVNGAWALGEEPGWRGYLLPRLWPLGRGGALALSGGIWGLWHAPLVAMGFDYPGHPVAGILFMMMLTTLFGVLLGYLRLRHGSVQLAALAHGAFNAQMFGVWPLALAGADPLLGGMTGIAGLFFLALVAAYCLRRDWVPVGDEPAPRDAD
ncbi:MAG: CPBP family intramembrane metalloprotease [Thermaerobacter sp.]|jgi:membrane protease YdiL (CAAX protease family)|nr:CPBP family intramembrane metalloprotease [Thermaerobacter sp.]